MSGSPYRGALRRRLLALSKEQLIGMLEDAARNWLAHDGLWFQAAEAQCGMETAIELDARAWERFAAIESQRIMQRHAIAPGGGLDALHEVLGHRLYAYLNEQATIRPNERTLIFRMEECRVQAARRGMRTMAAPTTLIAGRGLTWPTRGPSWPGCGQA